MDSTTVARLAGELKQGKFPDSQPADLDAAVDLIKDDIDSRQPITLDQARAAAKTLVRNRQYVLAQRVAKHWLEARGFDATMSKHRAQALINLGSLDEAEKLLNEALPKALKDDSSTAKIEIPELEGLIGRVFKQRFVITQDPDWLVRSRARYMETYLRNQVVNLWHGINACALRAREELLGLGGANLLSSAEIGEKVRDVARREHVRQPTEAFHAATASEACLAMGDCEAAELWLYRFLHHPEVKPFDIEAFDRQLREIWQGSPLLGRESCADRLSTIVARHIARTQRRFFISASEIAEAKDAIERGEPGLEKNFTSESTFTVESVKQLLEACGSVGCVTNASGVRLGTGFLISGTTFGRGDEPIFVTNEHVISKDDPKAIAPDQARVTFEIESASSAQPVYYSVEEVLFSSPAGKLGARNSTNDELDVTVVRLKGLRADAPVLKAARRLPALNARTRVYVVGHPNGSGIQIALQDSRLIDVDDEKRLVHYRTPTDPGSSGSPVFNTEWQVVALHHGGSVQTPRLRGDGSYEANEGISLQSIRSKWAP